ncbi:hypothetical protein [Demequina muriae]|uniref:Uncharacterized protein n=1 Tax=Demequina muriae TaxID=3051664 RepID=A0ABT8GDD8_9MICO|nr:hypothetical protein [Demequina sp. EGI L300058]MDN4479442.1 hypothetical protein [Demequina sp. EGI L300058]
MVNQSRDESTAVDDSGAIGRGHARGAVPVVTSAPGFSRRLRTVAAVAVCAGLLAACSSDSDADASADDADASPIAAESSGADEASDGAGDDSRDDSSEDSGADAAEESSGGVASGTAQWDGETYEYDSVMCQDQSQFGQFTIVANGPDAPTLGVKIEFDPLEEPDYSQPSSVELFFGEGGATVGEGEGYETPYGPVEGATSSTDGASGSVRLDPDESTTAPDVNPDGGQLDFEVTCG